MKYSIYTLIIVLAFASVLSAQTSPDTLWTRIYGGDFDDVAKSLDNTNDGGFIITGNTLSFGAGSSDIWLLKVDENGEEEWDVTFGNEFWDEARCVKATSDNGYIIAGSSIISAGEDTDWIIIKTDENGEEEWTHIVDTGYWDSANFVIETDDNGFVIAGQIADEDSDNICLMKLDAEGEEEWNRTFGSTEAEDAYNILKTDDGGFVILGYTASVGEGGMDVRLIKTDSEGLEEWARTYGGEENDVGFSIESTTDEGYIIGGYTNSFGEGQNDFWLVKTDSLGEEIWNYTFGTSETEIAYSVMQTSDEKYVIAGWTSSGNANSNDSYIVKADSTGLIWSTTLGDVGNDKLFDLIQNDEQEFIFAGHLQSFDSNSQDCWLVKYDAEEVGAENYELEIPSYALRNYPNPFNPSTTISFEISNEPSEHLQIEIYNVKGRIIRILSYDCHPELVEGSVTWNGMDNTGDSVSSGIYFYKLKSDGKTLDSNKMLLIK